MTLAQTSAVEDRIKTIPALAAKTFVLTAPRDSTGKLPATPYVVIQPSDGVNTQSRYTGPRGTAHPRFVIHVVGSSYTNAQTVLELVKAKFIDPATQFAIPVVVPGEACKHLTFDCPLPVQKDDDVTPPLIYATAELAWDVDK